jgi:hypothetical protein
VLVFKHFEALPSGNAMPLAGQKVTDPGRSSLRRNGPPVAKNDSQGRRRWPKALGELLRFRLADHLEVGRFGQHNGVCGE